MTQSVRPICRCEFDSATLMADYRLPSSHPNKHIVFGIACPPSCQHSGQIVFSRWASDDLPTTISVENTPTQFECRDNYFGYEPTPDGTATVEWYLNFAHQDLFCAYSSSLFAQDEMQVAEHPALGALREALLQSGIEPWTVENDEPTPILIAGVERRCQVATNPDSSLGRPFGLYGNQFARASSDAVRRATESIMPPTTSNIIAMEAPAFGEGAYTRKQIAYVLATALTGYMAARLESIPIKGPNCQVVVHTGFWGCGAYGGNRVLMAFLQLLAAQLAGLDRLVFHTGDIAGVTEFEQAKRILTVDLQMGRQTSHVSDLVAKLGSMNFRWGVSDGN